MKEPSIKKNFVYSTAYQILNVITPFITAPYVSRVLGAEGIGIQSYTASVQYIFLLIASLGTLSYGSREISMHRDDVNERSKLFWEIELMVICTTGIALFGWVFLCLFSPRYKIFYCVLSIGIFANNGLKAIKEDNEETKDIVVVIHDGNRPMLPQDVITDNLVKQKLFGSAVTVIPTTEVVFVSKDGVESNAALNREELWRTQTPHSYRFDELWTVHNQAIKDGVTNMAASCSLMQKYGYTTYFSKGSEKNIKITTVEDIEIFKALLSAKNDEWIKK